MPGVLTFVLPALLGAATSVIALDSPPVHPEITALSRARARPGERVEIRGHGFGRHPGQALLGGLRVDAELWSDDRVQFQVPEEAASGGVRLRTVEGRLSNAVPLRVRRPLPAGQFAPFGFECEDTGLLGAAFLVETDGDCLYGVCGLDTLVTCRLAARGPHRFCSRQYLNQRVGDLRLAAGYLFCAGDHGLRIYRCADLRRGPAEPVAALAGGSFLSVDARPDPAGKLPGLIVGLAEYAPRHGSSRLRVRFYQFVEEALQPLGSLAREAGPEERQYALALDPARRKAYVSGAVALFGTNRYLLELSWENPRAPTLLHREPTPRFLAFDLEAADGLLWAGLIAQNKDLFQVYALHSGVRHLQSRQTIKGRWAPVHTTRVKLINSRVALGCAWAGQHPDVFLLDASAGSATPLGEADSLDWAFDLTGAADPGHPRRGRLLVADEWGGFLTWRYDLDRASPLQHAPDYQQIVTGSMTEGLQLARDRIYIANRGAGVWSADRQHLAAAARWRAAPFQWPEPEPQPHPISALAVRRDPDAGLLIAALGHEKAMAWGHEVIGLLYRETSTRIELLAAAKPVDPPGLWSRGVSVVWPRRDLVFMTTGTDGFRAYVIDPRRPGITLHRQCQSSGLDAATFDPQIQAVCLQYLPLGDRDLLVVGCYSTSPRPRSLLHFYTVSYPEGPPDRHHPDAPLRVVKTASLQCAKFKNINQVAVHSSGWIALATSRGLALFHRSWLAALNGMPDPAAWERIRIPADALRPWWHDDWSAAFQGVAFADARTLCAVKNPQGVWRLAFTGDRAGMTAPAFATAYYPGVECGLDYTRLLHGWADPDIPTLHNPYALTAEGNEVYVTGWSGKVRRLRFSPQAGVTLLQTRFAQGQMTLVFSSPHASRHHCVEETADLRSPRWTPLAATVHPAGNHRFVARFSVSPAPRRFYRLRVEP
jgi:hypothetical protein